jgi:hypothetical protein
MEMTEALLVDFFYSGGFGDVDLDAGLEDGAVIMKIMRSTITTSMNGTMLISESVLCVVLESCGIVFNGGRGLAAARPK